jgi:hypothetical protein
MALWLSFLLHIWDISGTVLGPSAKVFRGFPQLLHVKGTVL